MFVEAGCCTRWVNLRVILSSRATTPGETKLLASEIYELLQASSGADSEPAEEAVGSRRKAQFFLGSSNKRAKTVILHIDGLDDSVSGDIIPSGVYCTC